MVMVNVCQCFCYVTAKNRKYPVRYNSGVPVFLHDIKITASDDTHLMALSQFGQQRKMYIKY